MRGDVSSRSLGRHLRKSALHRTHQHKVSSLVVWCVSPCSTLCVFHPPLKRVGLPKSASPKLQNSRDIMNSARNTSDTGTATIPLFFTQMMIWSSTAGFPLIDCSSSILNSCWSVTSLNETAKAQKRTRYTRNLETPTLQRPQVPATHALAEMGFDPGNPCRAAGGAAKHLACVSAIRRFGSKSTKTRTVVISRQPRGFLFVSDGFFGPRS